MSSIRVNPNPMPDLLNALEKLQLQQQGATLQMATGSRINQPADDPAGASEMVQINDRSSQVDTFQRSISSITGVLSTADSTLGSVVTVLQRAITLGVEGANGTLSDDDRAAVATELVGIQNQLMSLANVSYQGRFIFSGTADTQPYVIDGSSPSGIRYAGNDGTNNVTIGNGYQIQVNMPGSQIFNGPGADVFQAISNLIQALQTNTDISTAASAVSTAFNYVTTQRVFFGNALNQTESQQSFLNDEKMNLSQQQDAVSAADMAAVASQISSGQTAMNATLASMGKMPQVSLFDYLK